MVLRAFQVYGPGDHPTRLVPVVLEAARTGGTVALPARVSRRDWVWVGDVVDACLRAAVGDDLPPGVVLNIGTGVQTSTEELVETAARVTGRPIATAPGAHPGRDWDTADWVCDPTAARRAAGVGADGRPGRGAGPHLGAVVTPRIAVVAPGVRERGHAAPAGRSGWPRRWTAGTGGCGWSSTPRPTAAPPSPAPWRRRTPASRSPC